MCNSEGHNICGDLPHDLALLSVEFFSNIFFTEMRSQVLRMYTDEAVALSGDLYYKTFCGSNSCRIVIS